ENFIGKREHHGAALAVYHKGKLVVDLWGGVADRVGGKQWNKNTYASIFCCTKSLAAICMAMKVDRGECSYTDKVTKYWPEFGRNDKNDITIEMILTHRAGLPNFDADFTLAEVTPEKISKIIEAESPKYMPGTKTSYHAITYGWLIDQLFCRIDKRQRSISDFFHDEIQKKHGVEVSVGTSPELEEQTAKFPPVTKRITLRENFIGKREHHGAALAVYHKGKLVVDLWGGVADRVGGKQWNKNTYASIFCCTKSLAAICMAMKVDRGECSYTDKVTKYWPEFGRNDKNDITIEMILTHRAGLPNFDADFTLAEVTPEKISKIIEAESPKYMPGTKTSYHAITYGWLIDQLFCRIDKRQRSISDFFHDEIQKKHGGLKKYQTLISYQRGSWQIGHPAIGGQRVYMDPANKLVVCYLTNGMKTWVGDHPLCFKNLQLAIYQAAESHGQLTCSAEGSWQIGHPAIGGQRVYMDPANKLVVCYLTNGMKTWVGDHPLCFKNLQLAIYQAAESHGQLTCSAEALQKMVNGLQSPLEKAIIQSLYLATAMKGRSVPVKMRSALIAFGLFAIACVAFAEQKKDKTELSETGVAVLDKLRALRKEGELALEALEDDKDQDAVQFSSGCHFFRWAKLLTIRLLP
ncbi:unnamed protein product, partial [Nippostrongylus brasiliensis]|uniref:Beta-lactamase domain-containing protein n=1 Tax=Nippostrongylus brasiliensis TaxID=27835 RepID=A0A158R248_NIPBR